MKKLLKSLFCKHKNSEVICWHWTHGINCNEIKFLEIQLRCNDYGKYYFAEIRDLNDCHEFILEHKEKEWSDICKPIL